MMRPFHRPVSSVSLSIYRASKTAATDPCEKKHLPQGKRKVLRSRSKRPGEKLERLIVLREVFGNAFGGWFHA